MYRQCMFWTKKLKIKNFPMIFLIFASEKKSLYIAWASFGNISDFLSSLFTFKFVFLVAVLLVVNGLFYIYTSRTYTGRI